MNLTRAAQRAYQRRRMSGQQRGKRFETKLCGEIYDETNGELLAEPIGYSGNHRLPAPDVRIDDGHKVHAFELKKTSKDRISLNYEPDNTGRDDLHQLLTYCRQYPRIVVPYIGVKFNHRQLVLAKLWLDAPNDRMTIRSATKTAPTSVNLTHAGNLSFQKPSLDEWYSSQAGNDAQYVLDTIGYY